MATEQQYKDALIKAHEAGDTQAAQLIANKIKELRVQGPQIELEAPAEPEKTMAERGQQFAKDRLGTMEAAGSVISGAIAEPLAGLSGIGAAVFGGDPTEAIKSTRERLTYSPRTEEGKSQSAAFQDLLQPVAEAIGGASESVGRFAQETATSLGASPEFAGAAGAAGETLIPGLMELAGFKGLRSSTLNKVKELPKSAQVLITEAAPTIQQIKSKSSQLYKQLDDSGVKVKPQVYDRFVDNVVKDIGEAIDPGLHPKSTAVLKRLSDAKSQPKTFTQLNNLRRLAADAAFTMDKADARIGKQMLSKLDNGIDIIAEASGGNARGARDLWRRAKVAESIGNMIEDASLTASGFENGLRIEARKILKSPRKSKGFTKAELNALRDLEKGSTAQNAAKFLGKFGISEGKATSMVGSAISATAGNAIAGAPGAMILPAIGQIAKNTAQRLTLNKAKFAENLARAGGNGRAVAEAYVKNTPKALQKVEDLTQLLLDPSITPESIAKIKTSSKIMADAKFFAEKIRNEAKRKASQAAMIAPTVGQEEND